MLQKYQRNMNLRGEGEEEHPAVEGVRRHEPEPPAPPKRQTRKRKHHEVQYHHNTILYDYIYTGDTIKNVILSPELLRMIINNYVYQNNNNCYSQ